MKHIILTRNKTAIVDDCDFENLRQFNWYAGISKNNAFYAKREVDRKCVYMHRKIIGALPGQIVDHIDGNTLNNQRFNLRIVDKNQSATNTRKSFKNKSGFKGVSYSKSNNGYIAQISHMGKMIHLGTFDTIEAAAISYKKASIKYHGDFARKTELI
jgi:hypothetical protein